MAGLAFPPDTLFAGRYRPVSLIANGGMGQVLEAVDERLRRPVAVKLVNTASDEEAQRLRAEGLSLARLRHPNIVGIYDTGDHDGRTFIVTELVRGESLLARMQREGPLPLDTVAALGTDIARALECAHHHGIVHRDLKPANILIDDEGRARLIDFGIATSEHATSLPPSGRHVHGQPAVRHDRGRRGGGLPARDPRRAEGDPGSVAPPQHRPRRCRRRPRLGRRGNLPR